MMDPAGEDLDAAYYVAQRLVNELRAGAPPVPRQVIRWCLKVRLAWETSADGPETDDVAAELEPYTVPQAAAEMHVTERHVRRLAKSGAIDARRYGREWIIPRQAVTEWRQRG